MAYYMGMDTTYLTPREVDVILRYPAGRTSRLARAGKIPHVTLPDGEIRIDERDIHQMMVLHDGMIAGRRHDEGGAA
jgi:hypothetical protein